MVRTPWMRLPMSFVPPVVRDIFSNRRGGKKWEKASMWRMGPLVQAGGVGHLPREARSPPPHAAWRFHLGHNPARRERHPGARPAPAPAGGARFGPRRDAPG